MGISIKINLIKKSPNSIETVGLYKLENKKVAIDTSIFHKSLANVRHNGDYLRNTRR